MKKNIVLRTLLLFTALTVSGVAAAGSLTLDASGNIVISERERVVLRDYYHHEYEAQGAGNGKAKKLNKGMEKRLASGKGLPPGWQKKMARGEVVPGDIWRYHQPLPGDVIRRLPAQPDGVITVRIDNQIVRVIAATHVLLDAFDLY
jgi:hypothetical protein